MDPPRQGDIMSATPKQVAYALHLLGEAGYGTDWMRSEHKALGATMRERSGTVEGWLRKMNRARISSLIKTLVAEAA